MKGGGWEWTNPPRRCSWGKTGLDVANCKRSTSQGILGDSIPPKNPPAPDRSENCWSDFTAIPAFVLRGITLRQLRAITAILRSNTVSEKMDQHQGRRDFSESRQSHTVWYLEVHRRSLHRNFQRILCQNFRTQIILDTLSNTHKLSMVYKNSSSS